MEIEVFEFLGEEAPVALENIREAIDLVGVSMDEGMEALGEKVSIAFANKEFEKIKILSENSNKLNLINEKIQELVNEFDNIINIKEIEEADELREKAIPNYEEYLVDTNVEHSLYENLTYKRPHSFKINNEIIEVKDWKSLLVETLNYLAQENYEIIESFVDDSKMNGKKIKYFANMESEIMRGPRKIDRANIYVETNLSANGIRNLLVKILKKFNIKLNDYKIYLKADYSELH